MAKRQPHIKAAFQRRCIFCGSPKVSGEHLWPEWMHPYLPKQPNAMKREIYNHIKLGKVLSLAQKKPQQGHTYTKKVRAVCKPCNEIWMSRIEEEAKPILIPLLRGLPLLLDREKRSKLAVWLALKVMVGESHDPRDAVTMQEDRTAFMLSRTIPPYMKIWIGSHDSEDWYMSYWHQTARINLTPDPPAGGNFKNIQSTALGIGHILSLTIAATVPHCEIDLTTDQPILPLWPLQREDIEWPLQELSSESADRLATTLGWWLAESNPSWVPLS